MAETILVTGATGTVGREVVKQLSAKGEQSKQQRVQPMIILLGI